MTGQIKILLIENAPEDRSMVKHALKQTSYRSATFLFAKSAVDAEKFHGENITLSILDLGLEGQDGLEAINQLRKSVPDGALICVTDSKDDEFRANALQQGAQNSLSKEEIKSKTLDQTIRFSLEHHDIVQQLNLAKKQLTEANISLEQSEACLLEAQAIAKVGSWQIDLHTECATWSTETYRIFEVKFTQDPLTISTVLTYVHPEDLAVVKKRFANSFDNDEPNKSEHRIVCGNGTVKWIEECWKIIRNGRGVPVRAAGTSHDITELKKAEQQILNEKKFTDALISSLPGIFYLYDRDGIFTRWNKNLETISGYSSTEIANMHPLDFYDQNEKKLIPGVMETLFAEGSKELTVHFYSKDRKKVPYHFSGHKISFNNKDYLIGVGIDITLRVEREQNLLAYTDEIKKLTAHVEHVREEERTRISREIHDELGQQITCLKMDASWLVKKIPASEKSVHDKLSNMISMMDNTVKTIRRISSDLRPGVLDNLGLVPALEWQSSEFQKNNDIRCVFKSEEGDITVESGLATGIFRIYQETLTNILRHAKATNVQAVMTQTKEFLTLCISDNGQGFNLDEAKRKATLGLIGMRERTAMMGGELRIESMPGQGTKVMLKIPLALNKPDS